MEERSLTLTVLGVVIITAIVGMVLLFTAARTGAGVYGGALKGDPFPYTRYIEGQPVVETPGYEDTLIQPDDPVYGGADKTIVDWVDQKQVPREVQDDVLYKRNPYKKTRTGLISCSVLNFPSKIYAPMSVSKQQFDSYRSMGKTCFAQTAEGTPVTNLIGDYACCTR